MSSPHVLAHRHPSVIFRLLCLLPLLVAPTYASVIVSVYQSGPDVVSSYSGSVDLAALSSDGVDGITAAFIQGKFATEVFGPTVGSQPVYPAL